MPSSAADRPGPVQAPPEDLVLRDRVVAGDPDATSALFERHVDALYEFVHYRLGGERSHTEDVVQETFVVALEKLAGFDGRSSLHTWLCGIARNKMRALRRKKRPKPLADVLDEADEEIHDLLLDVERTPLPEWVLEQRETADLVGATLGSLPPDTRELLLEKYVEGLPVAHLAERRGLGLKATESRLHRARLAFSRVFELLVRKRGGYP